MREWVEEISEYIPKQPEESVFGGIGFPPHFSPCARTVSSNAAARAGQKIWGASLPNSRFFQLFRYMQDREEVNAPLVELSEEIHQAALEADQLMRVSNELQTAFSTLLGKFDHADS